MRMRVVNFSEARQRLKSVRLLMQCLMSLVFQVTKVKIQSLG